ncbi:MAG: haloacid dehalogenase [Chloroflexi bacterium]|nr:MAG: haloacid dehalogenase [Chloroflexota bacterium]
MEFHRPLRGILFDFDGLILDTEMPIFQAWKRKFREYGQELLLEEWAQILGKSNQELGPIEGLLEEIPDPEVKKRVLAEVAREEQTLVKEQLPLPGVVELITRAHRGGLKLGIVSSSNQDWVHGHLDRLELLEYFDHTSCADEVEVAKPDPALYHLGLDKMGIDPACVVVLEDSPNGVQAAKRAGLYCIAVPNQLTRQLPFCDDGMGPDRFLTTLEDFPWDELMRTDS